jgi:hypothetical protein
LGKTAASYVHRTFNVLNRDADVMAAFGNWRPGEGSGSWPLPDDCWKEATTPRWRLAVHHLANVGRTLVKP